MKTNTIMDIDPVKGTESKEMMGGKHNKKSSTPNKAR